MDNTGIMPVMPMGGDGLGGAGNSFMFIFGLLILLGLFNGGLGGGGNSNTNAIQADVNRGFDNQNLQAQTRDILGAVTGGTAQTIAASTANATNAINAIKDGNAALIREFGTVENALTGLAGQSQQCCCEILRAIDGVNYNNAQNTQKIIDTYNAGRMADMQGYINKLELEKATCGLLRFPNQWTYNGGVFPPAAATAAAG